MGYIEKDLDFSHYSYDTLITNYADFHSSLTNMSQFESTNRGRYFINHYNPELFLALAGMREGDQIHVGEYLKCLKRVESDYYPHEGWIKNNLYKIETIDNVVRQTDTQGSFGDNPSPDAFRKATKEEIIDWFTKPQASSDNSSELVNEFLKTDHYFYRDSIAFPTPECQDSGYKESENKLSYELDWEFIESMAKRMQKGGQKYSPYNWKKPLDPEQLKQALFRHVIEVMKGNYEDDGSLLGHIEALSCNSMMLWYQLKHNKTNE